MIKNRAVNSMSFKKYLRYKFDNFMAKGPKAMFAALFLATLVSVAIGATLIIFLTKETTGPEIF